MRVWDSACLSGRKEEDRKLRLKSLRWVGKRLGRGSYGFVR